MIHISVQPATQSTGRSSLKLPNVKTTGAPLSICAFSST